ncbi:MAG: hypothetical protein AMXMBFR46_06420 [Acidimicrobiia bacterium]
MTPGATPRTTVCVVPRDRFSVALRSLDHLLAGLSPPFRVVYVDGGSPPRVRDALRRLAPRHDFTLVRSDHYLSPNEARNLAFRRVRTEFVAFLDNDAFCSPGWLPALEHAADEHGAAVVAPVYGIASTDPARPRVHVAGADNRLVVEDGTVHHHMAHHHVGEDPASLMASLEPQEIEQAEFHCFFARTDAITAISPLDENLLSLNEHLDAVLRIREQGGTVWLEPSVLVTYVAPGLAWSDRRFSILRWSRDWNEASVRRFRAVWGVAPEDPQTLDLLRHADLKRGRAYRPYRSIGGRIQALRGRHSRSLPDRLLTPLVVRAEERRRGHGRSPAVAYRASWDR